MTLILALAAPLSLIGCWRYSALPDPIETPFLGPSITVDSTGPEHVLIVELPSPGWQFTLDATREALNRRNVFVTLRQPQPGVAYSTQVVTQRLTSTVRSSTPIAVFSRIVSYDDRNSSTPHAPTTTQAALQ